MVRSIDYPEYHMSSFLRFSETFRVACAKVDLLNSMVRQLIINLLEGVIQNIVED